MSHAAARAGAVERRPRRLLVQTTAAAASDTPPARPACRARQTFEDSEQFLYQPAGLRRAFHATPTTDLRASIYQGYRCVPDAQRAVPALPRAERRHRGQPVPAPGADDLAASLGPEQRWGPFTGRAHRLLERRQGPRRQRHARSTRLPDCPAGTTRRQRQNLDLARIRGVETDLEASPLAREWRFRPRLSSSPTRRVVDAAPAAGPRGQAPGAGAHEHRHRLCPLHAPGPGSI